MTSSEQKLELFKRELVRLEKRKAKATEIIESKSPASKYFEIMDKVTNANGKFNFDAPNFNKLIRDGAELEGNLVDLDSKHLKATDKAYKTLAETDILINNLKNEISFLNMRLVGRQA